VVAASFALTAEILHKKEEEIAVLDFSVESSSDKDKQAPHVLAKVLLRKAEEIENRGSGVRKKLELVGYFILLGSAALALVRVWWPSGA